MTSEAFPWRELHELHDARAQSLEAECTLRGVLQHYPPAPPGLSILTAVSHVLATLAAENAQLRADVARLTLAVECANSLAQFHKHACDNAREECDRAYAAAKDTADLQLAERNKLNLLAAQAHAERDAYRKAKDENDERFMLEREDARRERDAAFARAELAAGELISVRCDATWEALRWAANQVRAEIGMRYGEGSIGSLAWTNVARLIEKGPQKEGE